MNSSNSIVIDNCIVSNYMGVNGLSVTPIRLVKKMNPTLNIDSLQKITYGDRMKDNVLLAMIMNEDRKYKFQDILNTDFKEIIQSKINIARGVRVRHLITLEQ